MPARAAINHDVFPNVDTADERELVRASKDQNGRSWLMELEILTSDLLNMATLAFMGVTGIAIVRIRNLFAVVMLGGIYSLLGATLYVILDAVDVAFTEAAVGAGASTVLMLARLRSRLIVRKRPRTPQPSKG